MSPEFDSLLPSDFSQSLQVFLSWLRIGSDVAIAISCISMPVALAWSVVRRPLVEVRGVLWVYAAFFVLCGLSHALGSLRSSPVASLDLALQVATAVVASVAAVATIRALPGMLVGPSSSRLMEINQGLQLYAQAFEATDEAMMIVNADGRVERVNAAFGKITGYAGVDVIGEPLRFLDPCDNSDGLEGIVWSALKTAGNWSGDVWDRRKNGERYPKFLKINAVYMPDRQIGRFVVLFSDISDRREAEEALRASEARWMFALEGAGDGVWDYDFQSGTATYSKRYREIYGLADGDVHDWQTLVHPDDMLQVMNSLDDYLGGRVPSFAVEYRMRCKDGSWKWVMDRGMVVRRGIDGEPLRMIGTHSDITRLKEIQRGQVVSLLESSPQAILMVARGGRVEFANRMAGDVFGWAQTELQRMTLDDLVPGTGSASIFFGSSDSQAVPASATEWTGRRKDGSDFSVEIHRHHIRLDHQPVVIVTVLDVSERKRVEREMQLAAMVYQAIGEAIMVADCDNRIIAVNPAFTRLTGYDETEVIGMPTSLLKSGLHSSEFYRDMWECLERTGHWQGEINNRRKSGEIYLEWLAISNIYGDNGKVLRRVAMFSDITEQKRAEQTIWKQANFDPLTGLPNRRMFMDRLGQSIKEARRYNRFIGVLFIDLDYFKDVNDSHGHDVGDMLLKEVTRRLQLCVRESDTVARLGGDEFTVILNGLEKASSVDRIAQSVLDRLISPYTLGPISVTISASIGISLCRNADCDCAQLIKQADQAMYVAKQQGRNRFRYFSAVMQNIGNSDSTPGA